MAKRYGYADCRENYSDVADEVVKVTLVCFECGKETTTWLPREEVEKLVPASNGRYESDECCINCLMK